MLLMNTKSPFASFFLGVCSFFGVEASLNAQGPELVATTEAKTPAEEGKSFRLPKGMKAQLVAAEPDIYKPMNIAWDDQGRLWVTSTLEYPYPAKDLSKARDQVSILSDFGADGKAGKITTFATGLNIPIGLLPLPGKSPQRALVFHINQVVLLEDTDLDGKADKREVILSGYGFADTHGMTNAFTLAPDGWIYATHGFANNSQIKGKDGRIIKLQSGNTYRFRPDGTGLEQFTYGQVNPFGLAMDRWGNFFTADCHSRPVYSLLRGAFYPSFGKPHDGLGYGPEMCKHDHGSTGIAGCLIYSGDLLGTQLDGQVFLGNVVTSRVNRDRIEWKGSSPTAVELPDLIISEDPWFRPVDIKTGPDGAIYIADFYNRIIGHYEVPLTHPGRDRYRGRIWRVVPEDFTQADSTKIGRLTEKSVDELLTLLGNAQWDLAIRASFELESRCRTSKPDGEVLLNLQSMAENAKSGQVRALALWTLVRLNQTPKEKIEHLIKGALEANDPLVRVHATRMVALLGKDLPKLTDMIREKGLKDQHAMVRRTAAETLARLKVADNVDPLLDAMVATPAQDDHLAHALKISLRDQFVPQEETVKQAWEKANEPGRSQDQIRLLAGVSLGVPSAQAADFLARNLDAIANDNERLTMAFRHVGKFGDNKAWEKTVAFLDGPQGKNRTLPLAREWILGTRESGRPLSQEALKRATESAKDALASNQAGQVDTALALVGELRLEEAAPALLEIIKGSKRADGHRIAAAQALLNLSTTRFHPVLLELVKDSSAPTGLREQWVIQLGRIHQPALLAALGEVIKVLPYRLQLAAVRELAGNKDGGDLALTMMSTGKWPPRLIRDRVIATRLEGSGATKARDRVTALEKVVPPGDNRVDDLIKNRVTGFAKASSSTDKGKELFTKHCANCHQMGGAGAKFGPQLDGIGARGLERMCEDILDPSRNVDQAFRQTVLALKSGQVYTGLVTRNEGNLVVIVDQLGKEISVEKGNIEEQKVTNLSPMPANFAESIPEKDFADLLAFLLAQKVAMAPATKP